MADNHQIVSFDNEKLILVDEQDNILGYGTKSNCHNGDGILHRAFSIFIFNDKKQLLIQKRAAQKRLWPLYWSNSCCSHPRKGEEIEVALQRRLQQEIGITTPLHFIFKFQYHAKFNEKGSEREVCSVYIGRSNETISPNQNEIAEWKFIDMSELGEDLSKNPDEYSPWLKMEWERIQNYHIQDIEDLC